MTVALGYAPQEYLTTGVGPYTFTFFVANPTDIQATINSVVLDQVDYVVALNANQTVTPGGTLTFLVAPVNDQDLVIFRLTQIDQNIDYTPYDSFPAEVNEFGLDKLTLICQELQQGQLLLSGNAIRIDDTGWTYLAPADTIGDAFDNTDLEYAEVYQTIALVDNSGILLAIIVANNVNRLDAIDIEQDSQDLLIQGNNTAIGELGSNTLHTGTPSTLLMSDNPAGPLVQELPLSTEDIYFAVLGSLEYNNAPQTLVQVGLNGKIDPALIPVSDLMLVGFWDPVIDGALPPVLPGTYGNGDFMVFSAPGDMTLLTGANPVPHTETVASGEQMIALIGGAFPDGWYYVKRDDVIIIPASDVLFDNTGTAYDATTVQEALAEIDGQFGSNQMVKKDGSVVMTGALTIDLPDPGTAGGVILKTDSGTIKYKATSAGGFTIDQADIAGVTEFPWIAGLRNGGVSLNYGGAPKIDTSADGVTIIGQALQPNAPGLDGDLANKKYVDDSIAAAIVDNIPSHVGQIVQTFSTDTPNVLGYAGTWVKIASDLSIRTDAAPNATPQGDNNPAVPLLEHGHTASFSGTPLGDHSHSTIGRATTSLVETGGSVLCTVWESTHTTDPAAAGTPAGTVNVNVAGAPAASINVRGQFVTAVSWHRTA